METTSPADHRFPAAPGWAYASRYDDIDAQAAHFRGFGQHYEQLSAGRFDGQFRTFSFGEALSIHLESANRDLMQSAVTPRGRFGLSVIAAHSPPCVLNAASLDQERLILYPAGQLIEGKTPEGMQIFCIDMDERLLPDDARERQRVRIIQDAPRAQELRTLVATGVAAFRRLGDPAGYPAAQRDFTAAVAGMAWQLTQPAAAEPRTVRRQSRTRALRIYARARNAFIEELANGVSIEQVCKNIGVSRRSLECVFRSVVDLSPVHYVRTLQLNCIRRDLLNAAELDASIGVIAARYGIWHWSRFAQTYRELFGELPSETRRRVARGTR